MITILLHRPRLLPFLLGGHRQLALENLALRHQISVYKRTTARPKLRPTDRLFWIGLARAWAGWRQALVIVTPGTVLRWQRRRFREYWTQLSGRTTGGRPSINAEIRALITRMASANPLWGAPRIHGELLKLGIDVSERSVSRLMPKRRPPPSQTWRTFLRRSPEDDHLGLADVTHPKNGCGDLNQERMEEQNPRRCLMLVGSEPPGRAPTRQVSCFSPRGTGRAFPLLLYRGLTVWRGPKTLSLDA